MNAEQIFETNFLNDAKVTPAMRKSWQHLGPWTLIIAFCNFIYLGITALALLVSAVVLSTNTLITSRMSQLAAVVPQPGLIIGIFYGICFAFLLFNFLMYRELYLYQPAIQKALKHNNQQQLEKAWRHIRNYFRYFGLVAILLLVSIIYGGVMLSNYIAMQEAIRFNEYPF
jgi:hypothetical protein